MAKHVLQGVEHRRSRHDVRKKFRNNHVHKSRKVIKTGKGSPNKEEKTIPRKPTESLTRISEITIDKGQE